MPFHDPGFSADIRRLADLHGNGDDRWKPARIVGQFLYLRFDQGDRSPRNHRVLCGCHPDLHYPAEGEEMGWREERKGLGNVLAALLGIPTPFCSCSAVPLFIGFVESGVPLGITFSFLIASPLINEVAVAMLFALFGWQIAVLYIVSGLIIAIVAGIIIGRLHLENQVEEFVYKCKMYDNPDKPMTWRDRFDFAVGESKSITVKVLPYILIGIAIGAIIHGYAPADFLVNIAGPDNPLAVPIAVLIGIPLYSNAAGMLPIMQVLTSKGMALGTALAFMMAVVGLSLPEMIILRRVIKIKLIAIFAGILFVAITLTGLLFNAILG